MEISLKNYQETVRPALQKELKLKNIFAVPRLQKIVLNIGLSDPQDPRARKQVLEKIAKQFAAISGQTPVITLAHKSISTFKLRQGDPLGVTVTLRGRQMWEFFQKLVSVALPRVKDFRGVSRTAFDSHGNYSLGIEEQIIFPEIEYDKIDKIRSLQATFVTSASNDEAAMRLLEMFGMPFAKVGKSDNEQ